ncbi:carbohydrate kinase family protein [Nocardia sp. NPDC020380]|uniref:carbohydrate kinase family protein n=1 Tax=Nocardia sp. NPDC020380 TaxID=3364309 RepID=UPI0037B43156
MVMNPNSRNDVSVTAVPKSRTRAVLSILVGLRKRAGLSPDRLRSTEIDVSDLLDLPVVRRYAHLQRISPREALPGLVAHVARQLPTTQRLIVDSELCLRLLDSDPPDGVDLGRLYAPDLGLRRRALSEQWDRLHEALGVGDIPGAPTERALRDAPEQQAFTALAVALTAGAVPDVVQRVTATVVGDAVMDHNIMVDEIPEDGMDVWGDLQEHPGGKGLNRAVALARLGLDARLLTVIGDDARGSEIQQYLSDREVDTSLVEVKHGRTPATTVIRSLSGKRTTIAFKQHRVCLADADIDRASNRQAITDSDAVLVTFETPMEVVERLLRVVDSLPRTQRPLLMLNISPPEQLPRVARRFLGAVSYVVGAPKDLTAMWRVGDSHLDTVFELLKSVTGAVCVIDGPTYRFHRPESDPYETVLPDGVAAKSPYSSAALSAALAFRLLGRQEPVDSDDFRWATAAVLATERLASKLTAEEGVPNVPDAMPTYDQIAAEVGRVVVRTVRSP